MTSRSLYGETYVRREAAASARAICSAMPGSSSTRRIGAPFARKASSLAGEALAGITISPSTPSAAIATAMALAWLPVEEVTTPAARCSAVRHSSALNAPRALNDPLTWVLSSFSQTSAPVWVDRACAYSSGVSRT